MRYASLGFWINGPIQFVWYSKVVPKIVTNSAIGDVAAKIALDICCYSFIINSAYLIFIPLLSLKSFKEARENHRLLILKTQKRAWTFWPFCNSINYAFVPTKYMIPYV